MEELKGKLILVRHHESTWNKLGLWSGKTDVPLSEYGKAESEKMGELLHGIKIDYAFTSSLKRSVETLSEMMKGMEETFPIEANPAIDERDYGDYTGKNKWEIKKIVGEEQFEAIRRGWNTSVPNGETLKMVSERVLPFYFEKVLPQVKVGKNVLLVAHGNSLRALIKYIENIPDDGIGKVEMPFGAILLYSIDEKGLQKSKEIRQIESHVNA